MSKGNEYFAMPHTRTITLTQDGLVLQYEDDDEEVYVRDDSDFAGHTPTPELHTILNDMYDLEIPEEITGYWACWDGWWDCWTSLESDGSFSMVSKEPGCPVHLLSGVWGVDQETNQIRILAEIAGEGLYPHFMTWDWEAGEEENLLILTEEDHFLMPEYDDGVWFWAASPEFYSSTPMVDAIGYVYPYYDLDGEYTDADGNSYFYFYELPQLLEDEGDMAEINADRKL